MKFHGYFDLPLIPSLVSPKDSFGGGVGFSRGWLSDLDDEIFKMYEIPRLLRPPLTPPYKGGEKKIKFFNVYFRTSE